MEITRHFVFLVLCIISCHFMEANSTVSLSGNLSSKCLRDQSNVLLQFKDEFASESTQLEDYSGDYGDLKTESWETGEDCCSWGGIECDRAGNVIGLDLSDGSLQGSLRLNSSLFMLTRLQRLNLAFSNFNHSSISLEFGKLLSLTHLNLSQSSLSGEIPNEISRLRRLVSLDLSSTNYVDYPPLSLGRDAMTGLIRNATNLRVINLNAVDLYSLKAEYFGNFAYLESLSLSECNLSGKLPEKIFNFPKIRAIDASNNDRLLGFLPEILSGGSLESLVLSSTKFSGSLVDSIGNLKSLEILNLGSCNFSGKIPVSLGNLSSLVYLDLSHNNFSGELPASLGRVTKLKSLLLSRNQISGPIPSSLGNLTLLIELQLPYNKLSGELPVSLANLTVLELFDVSNNQLTGILSSDIRRFPNSAYLGTVDLSHNSFSGNIPPALFTMPSLGILNLDSNLLIGPLTIRNVSSSRLAALYLRRNNLNGKIPNSIVELANLTDLYLNGNNFSGKLELGIFSELSSLATLELSHNNLSVISEDTGSFHPRFSSLGLSSCNITEFPRFLRTQNQLWLLDLSNNRIQGKIPEWFLNTTKDSLSLLDLSSNLITGWEKEPPVLPWNALDFFDLRHNKFRGSLVMPSPSTRYYIVSNNTLTGEIALSLCELTDLKVFDVSNNNLSGKIPRCLGSNSSLLVLNLQRNNFRGEIPEACNSGSALKTLDLSHNEIQGTVPRSLIECKELEVLNIGHNRIRDEFPLWTQSFPELAVLILRNNKFHSPIWHPWKFFGFKKLRIMDLSFNAFDGSLPMDYFRNWSTINSEIPHVNKSKLRYMGDTDNYYQDSITLENKGVSREYSKILTTLMAIDISNNDFLGKIPSSVGDLKSLIVLNLSSNNFEGEIPSSIGNLSELESLDLSNNRLSGEIPLRLEGLDFLSFLNLSDNRLEGNVPQKGQLRTFPNSSFAGNARLCGFPLSNECEKVNGKPDIEHGKTESAIMFGWKSAAIGFGCGIFIGLIGESFIAFRRPNYLKEIFGRRTED